MNILSIYLSVQNLQGVDSISEVDSKEGLNFAEEHDMEYFECSAERSLDVEAPFQFIANQSAQRYQERFEQDIIP